MTQADIAKYFGISQATVSLALNHPESNKVRKDLRQQILAYCRSEAPEAMPANRTWNLGFVIKDDACKHPFYSPLLDGAEAAADALGYGLFVARYRDGEPILRGRGIDGLVLCPRESFVVANAFEVPYVTLNCSPIDGSCDMVLPNNDVMIFQVLNYLRQLGHSRIVHIHFRPLEYTGEALLFSEERFDAFGRACRTMKFDDAAGVVRYVRAGNTEDTLRELDGIVDEYLAMEHPPTAFFCGDHYCHWLIQALERRGKRVPDDFSIFGFDDLDAHVPNPFLSSVNFNMREMGYLAVEQLHRRIANPAAPYVRLSVAPHLVLRNSVKNIKEERK